MLPVVDVSTVRGIWRDSFGPFFDVRGVAFREKMCDGLRGMRAWTVGSVAFFEAMKEVGAKVIFARAEGDENANLISRVMFEGVAIFGGPGQCMVVVSTEVSGAEGVAENIVKMTFEGETIAIAYCWNRNIFPDSMFIAMRGFET